MSLLLTGTLFIISCSQTADPIAAKKAELQKLKR